MDDNNLKKLLLKQRVQKISNDLLIEEIKQMFD